MRKLKDITILLSLSLFISGCAKPTVAYQTEVVALTIPKVMTQEIPVPMMMGNTTLDLINWREDTESALLECNGQLKAIEELHAPQR